MKNSLISDPLDLFLQVICFIMETNWDNCASDLSCILHEEVQRILGSMNFTGYAEKFGNLNQKMFFMKSSLQICPFAGSCPSSFVRKIEQTYYSPHLRDYFHYPIDFLIKLTGHDLSRE